MLKLYNSLTNTIEPFKPIHDNKVNMYVCGPTVYGDIHIGNARTFLFFDMFKDYLRYLGYQVTYASNVTDVDDKIIERAIREKTTEAHITQTYTKAFFEATLSLGTPKPDLTPHATDYMAQMIDYISDLINLGYAYQTPSGVYFRVHKVKDYGILSNQSVANLRQGIRIDLKDDKENPEDFVLWKLTDAGIKYESPWGKGRPGWHTECAVMTHDLFKDDLDIHGGGFDLKFPHHENEIAQCMAHDNHHLAKYFMHVGRLDFNKEKMSKSLGNTILVKDLLQKVPGLVYRFYLMQYHYRQPIEFNDGILQQTHKNYDRILSNIKKTKFSLALDKIKHDLVDEIYINKFKTLMNDDLNTPNVITLIEELMKEMNKETLERKQTLYNTLIEILSVFNVLPEIENIDNEIIETYRLWEDARNQKEYQKADSYRKILQEKGWV